MGIFNYLRSSNVIKYYNYTIKIFHFPSTNAYSFRTLIQFNWYSNYLNIQ